MAVNFLDKLTNFLVPEDDNNDNLSSHENKPRLKVFSDAMLNMTVAIPLNFDDVDQYAEAIRKGKVLIVNMENIDIATRQRVFDYLNGVSYVLNIDVEKISKNMVVYVPAHVDVRKELFAYSIPTYVKQTVQ